MPALAAYSSIKSKSLSAPVISNAFAGGGETKKIGTAHLLVCPCRMNQCFGWNTGVEDAVAAAFGVQLSVKAVHGAGGSARDNPGDPGDSPLVRAAMAMGARIIDDNPDNPDNPDNGDNGEAS